jgi:hypothetical protein
VHVVVRGQPAYRPWRRGPDWAFAAAAGSAFAVALSFVPGDYTPFIYFQF